MKRNDDYEQRLLKAVPDEALRLVARGWISLQVRDSGPALAWTLWDKQQRRFDICFVKEVMELPNEVLEVLMRHELGHIALGHFQLEKCGTDMFIATDISVNWYLRKHKDIINAIEGVDAEQWLEMMGLGQQPYPVTILHDVLHDMVEHGEADADGNGLCGGIEQTDDARATATSIFTDKAMQESGDLSSVGREAGTMGGSGIGLPYQNNLPPWLPAMEEFARATVNVVLADRRSHKRPQPALAGYGVHAPTQRPTWAPEPDTVVFLVDTSGSMWDELKYVQPVLEYLKRNAIEVRLIAGDVKVTFDEVVTSIPDEIGGGGGTEIVPLFVRAEDYEPKSMVVFSDAYISQIPKDPGVPTLWVGAQTEVPSWATKA